MRNNLGLFLTKRSQLNPRVEALVEVESGRRFSYADLEARANRTARALLGQGVGRGDRVAFLMMNNVEYVESYFATAKIGAVMVPLNWRLVPDELEFIVKDSGSTVMIYDAAFDAAVEELRTRATDVGSWIRVSGNTPCPDFARDYDELTGSVSEEPVDCTACDEDMLFIMYTSGTTGLPKGVVHTHGTMIAASTTINLTSDLRYRDRYLQMLPLFHVGALAPTTATLHRGGTVVLMHSFDPKRAFETIEQEKVTTGLAVPAMLRFMLQVPDHGSHDLSSVRWIMSGAAPVPVSLIEQYATLGIEIHQVYGLTESCGPACLISPDEAIAKAGSTGPAFFHTEVRVVDEAGRDVEPGQIGEVLVGGRHIMKEYWNRAEATQETLKDGWLHTGDLASVDKEGFLYIQDRKKDMVISGGENIYPAEIEKVLDAHSQLLESAVIGQPSAKWGEAPLAIVVVNKGESVSAEEILEFCQGKLARFKIPRAVEFVDEIPRNPTGKILKRVLRDRFPGPAPE